MYKEEGQVQEVSKISVWYFVVLVFILAVGFLTASFFLNWFGLGVDVDSVSTENVQVEQIVYDYGLDTDTILTAANIAGKIHMSLVPKKTEDPITIFSYDFDAEEPAFTRFQSQLPHMSVEFKDKLNPTEGFVLTLDRNNLEQNSRLMDRSGIHEFDLETADLRRVNETPALTERYLDWSPEAGLLTFAVMESRGGYEGLIDISNWFIEIVDPATKGERVIDTGIMPIWSPDGTKILYMKEDGLYLYDLEVDESVKVWGVANDGNGKPLNAENMIAVSPSGQWLVWTTPAHNLISVFRIDSWDYFSMKEVGRLQSADTNTQYYWPVFSPDNNFYVVQAIDQQDSGDRINARLEIRAVENREVLKEISLEEYDFLRAFTDDWTL